LHCLAERGDCFGGLAALEEDLSLELEKIRIEGGGLQQLFGFGERFVRIGA